MEAETLEERYSPEELKRLRGKLEGLRENLVSAAVREAGLRKRQVTVGRTSLGECLRQLREAQEGFLNLLEKSLILIDRVELLREKEAQKKKKKSPKTTRLVAANQDGGGGNNKTVPPGQSEGQTGGPEEQQHPQHLRPPLAPKETLPEEEGPEGSGLQKSEMEGDRQPDLQGEDQDPGDDTGDQGGGDGSECSNDGKEASDPQKSGAAEADRQPGAGGEAQDSGDEESEENSEDVCSDKDEDSEDNSDVDDYDEDKDMGARCDALWAEVGELEQKVGIMQNVSQEEVDALEAKVHDFFVNLEDIMREVKCDLKKKVIHLWSAVWKTPLQAVAAIRETLNSFLPVELTALKKESDSLRGFLQAIQSQGTVEKLADLIVRHLQNALTDIPLWKKLYALQDAIGRVPIKKLEMLKIKVKVLHWKADALQIDLFESLENELEVLKDQLIFLRDPSMEEELDELQETLDGMQYEQHYPLQEEVGTLQKRMDALQKKIDAWQKTNAPLQEVEELMETERSSFSETLKAPEAGDKQINAGARRITDQPANMVAKMAVPSSFETTNFLENAGRSSGSTGNLGGSVPASVPPSSTGVRKMWHGEVTLEERHRIVHRFAENISPGNDSTAAREKLAAYTKQIEEDMYELANSKMEYHQLMAKKLDAIQKNLDQSLRSSLSNQGISSNDLQASRTHPGAIPPVAVTTGQAQPLILPRGSQWNPTSTSSVQTPQPPIASCVPFSVNHPVQMNNIDSVSVGQVFGAALFSSLNTLRPQKSQLPCTPLKQPTFHYSVPSPSTVVGLPPTQCQLPLGMTPLPPPAPALLSIPASLSELHSTPVAGAVPDALQVQSTSWGQTSNGSTVSSPNRASDPRIVPTSADLTTAPPCSSGSWPPAGKRPFSGVEVAEETTIALQIPETTNLNRSKTQDPQQPEEAMCAKSSEDSLADCEPTMTETEPPHKKQKMDPVERTQVALFAQELYAAHQKYVKYVNDTVTQNTEKVGDLMGRLYGPPNQASALKDTEDAKALTFTLKKTLALLKCFLEDS